MDLDLNSFHGDNQDQRGLAPGFNRQQFDTSQTNLVDQKIIIPDKDDSQIIKGSASNSDYGNKQQTEVRDTSQINPAGQINILSDKDNYQDIGGSASKFCHREEAKEPSIGLGERFHRNQDKVDNDNSIQTETDTIDLKILNYESVHELIISVLKLKQKMFQPGPIKKACIEDFEREKPEWKSFLDPDKVNAPKRFTLLVEIGMLYYQGLMYKKALKRLDQAEKMNLGSEKKYQLYTFLIYNMKGDILSMLGKSKWGESEVYLRKAEQFIKTCFPEDTSKLNSNIFNFAQLYTNMNESEKAIEWFSKILHNIKENGVSPEPSVRHFYYVNILINQGELSQAENHLIMVLDIMQKNKANVILEFRYKCLLGKVYFQQRNPQAQKIYKEGLRGLQEYLAEGNCLSEKYNKEYKELFGEEAEMTQDNQSEYFDSPKSARSNLKEENILQNDDTQKKQMNDSQISEIVDEKKRSLDWKESFISYKAGAPINLDLDNIRSELCVEVIRAHKRPKTALQVAQKKEEELDELKLDLKEDNENLQEKLCSIYTLLAEIYRNAYLEEEALKFCEKAKSAQERFVHFKWDFSRTFYNTIGSIGWNFKEREQNLNLVSELSKEKGLGWDATIAQNYFRKGLLYLEQGRRDEAKLQFNKLISSGTEYWEFQIHLSLCLVSLYLSDNQKDDAKMLLKEIKTKLEEITYTSYLKGIYKYYMAEVHCEKEKIEKCLEKSRQIFAETLPKGNSWSRKVEEKIKAE